MKRFHVHVAVRDLAPSIRFYSTLFGAEPSVQKPDYAKWMLDDPRLNFAISTRAAGAGVDHLGLQVDTSEELAALEGQLRRADATLLTETATTCCYAKSDKHWVTDPQGIAWETFHTLGAAPVYGAADSTAPSADSTAPSAGACCGPAEAVAALPRVSKKPAAACC